MTPRLARAFAAAGSAALFVAGVVGVAFVGDAPPLERVAAGGAQSLRVSPDDIEEELEEFAGGDEDSAGTEEQEGMVEADPGDGGDDDPGSASGARPGGGPTPTTASPPSGPGSPSSQVSAPAAGVYRFAVSDDGETATANVTVKRPAGGAGETRIEMEDDYDEDRRVYALRSDGLYWLEYGGIGGEGGTCVWNPPLLVVKQPLAVGASWSTSSQCTVSSDEGSGTIRVTATSKVVRTERLTIGGQNVDTFVIETNADVASEFGGESFDQKAAETANFAPGLGLDVKSVSTTTMQFGDDSIEERRERTLQSTKPS